MWEYIEPLITCDKILQLFTPQRSSGYDHSDILAALNIPHRSEDAGYVMSALHKLEQDGYIMIYGNLNNMYKVTGETFLFKETGGYKGKVERENEIDAAKTDSEKTALKSANSVIDTNLSIQRLNTNTEIFYEKQTVFNNWQRGLTIAIFISTASYTVISYLQFKGQQGNTKQETPQLQQLTDSIKSNILNDTFFLKKLKERMKGD